MHQLCRAREQRIGLIELLLFDVLYAWGVEPGPVLPPVNLLGEAIGSGGVLVRVPEVTERALGVVA